MNWTLKRRNKIIASIKARVKKTTHKYGIEIPRSVEHAYEIDWKNGNTFWRDALKKEMSNIDVAFNFLADDEKIPEGYTKSSGHIIFDVKMNFTRKARFLKDGHLTKDIDGSNYAGIVSCDTVRIAFTYAALNGLDVCASDIRNAYIQAKSSEKHYIVCSPEFGENQGRRAIIVQSLYGGKCAGRDYWLHLRDCMDYLGFFPCKADSDLWLRKGKRSNGEDYYKMVLLYVDDCLAIADNPHSILKEEIGKFWVMKNDSIGPPTIYLGGKCTEVILKNGQKCWSFSSSQYVQSACKTV